ncbi:hypothetical protein N7582_001339 [Saccharomyces uvarum]|uniref:Cullin family profile domain-containing protein n=1 Tax=Saccharomyces uvarum TaxID=230603 RepID=A0AA35JH37_SACUV|nr:hypothetical protein N7582_001339 [Saccharomyces uvarum]CAI4059311.1 hypothetical protein SUVC_04G4730 [Saccharomyces uvarum]
MSIQDTVAKYTDVVHNLSINCSSRLVIKSEKLAQAIASSKSPIQCGHLAFDGQTVIYKCIKKELFLNFTTLFSKVTPKSDIPLFLHLYYIYQRHFQALGGQIKRYCGVKKYSELKFSAIDHLETGVKSNSLTLLAIWETSFDEFIRKEQRYNNNEGSDFQVFYKLMIEYASWKWASDSKRQYQFMSQFQTKLIECLKKFYEGYDLQNSMDPLVKLIRPWERAVFAANIIDSFTGEETRISGAELFWTFRDLVFSSISSFALRLSDLQNIFSTFKPYGKATLIQDFADVRSLKWRKDDTIERLVRALIFNDMFPYFTLEQVERFGDGIMFLRLLRKNFQESVISIKDFHVQVMKYLNSQFKQNYNSLLTSSNNQDTNKNLDMVPDFLEDDSKIKMFLSSSDGYTHTVGNKEPLWQHKFYPKIYASEQNPIFDSSTTYESHKIYAIISLLRYYLPEGRKFFRAYYLPSLFKRILYYNTKFPHLYLMKNCLERSVIQSLTMLDPSLVHTINNLVQSSIESLQNVTLTTDDKTPSSVILLPQKGFKSLCEVNKGFNEPFWPNDSFLNSWPDLANKRMERGQILHDTFAFHIFEIELPIIVDGTKDTHLRLVSNMCTASILYLYNETDSLPFVTIQEKLGALPSSKRNEILLNNLNRLVKLQLLLITEDKEGQTVYTFNLNYKSTAQSTSRIRLI